MNVLRSFMKKASLLVLSATLALSLSTAFAQNCSSLINDQTKTLTPADVSSIQTAAGKLVDQGIMPHVVFANGSATQAVETNLLKACPNWKAANMLTFIVLPSARLKNVYFGGALTPAFGDQSSVDLRFSKAANPYFKQGQFGEGIAASLRDFGAANVAYHDQAQHPVVSTTQVTEQATDLKPVASVFKILFGLIFLAALIGLVVFILRKRAAAKEAADAAQQGASAAMQKATTLYRNADSSLPGYADISSEYSDLSGQVSYDPSRAGLSASAYDTIAEAWNDLAASIRALASTSSSIPPRAYSAAAGAGTRVGSIYGDAPAPSSSSYPTPGYVAPAPQPTVIHETTYVDRGSGNDGLLTGMLIGDALSNDREDRREAREDREDRESRREEPSYSSPSYSEPARESSGSDSSWSGSSSSSDDDSSSSSSSGSDSSYSSSSDDSSSSSSDSGSGSDSSW
jgi:uncharacterized membrane protein YgcG